MASSTGPRLSHSYTAPNLHSTGPRRRGRADPHDAHRPSRFNLVRSFEPHKQSRGYEGWSEPKLAAMRMLNLSRFEHFERTPTPAPVAPVEALEPAKSPPAIDSPPPTEAQREREAEDSARKRSLGPRELWRWTAPTAKEVEGLRRGATPRWGKELTGAEVPGSPTKSPFSFTLPNPTSAVPHTASVQSLASTHHSLQSPPAGHSLGSPFSKTFSFTQGLQGHGLSSSSSSPSPSSPAASPPTKASSPMFKNLPQQPQLDGDYPDQPPRLPVLLPGGRPPLAWENALYLSRLEEVFHNNTVLGLQQSKEGDFDRARSCHGRALEAAMKLQSLPKQNLALGNLGLVSAKMADLATAEHWFLQHLECSSLLNDQRGCYRACKHLGELATKQGRHRGAAHFFNQSLRISQGAKQRTQNAAKSRVGISIGNAKVEELMQQISGAICGREPVEVLQNVLTSPTNKQHSTGGHGHGHSHASRALSPAASIRPLRKLNIKVD